MENGRRWSARVDRCRQQYGELPSALTSVQSPFACGVASSSYLRLMFFLFDIIHRKVFDAMNGTVMYGEYMNESSIKET